MRWVNNHVYFVKARSPLSLRILRTVASLPFENSKAWRNGVVKKICGPSGYRPVTDYVQFRDVYNICVLQVVMAAEENSSDDPNNVLFDHPLVRLTLSLRCLFRHVGILHAWCCTHLSRRPRTNNIDRKGLRRYTNVADKHLLQGWWDQHWLAVKARAQNQRRLRLFAKTNPACPNIDTVQSQDTFFTSVQRAMALHTR